MSRKIFRDVEEGISRELRRLSFFDKRTVSLTVLEDTYDVFTGEPIQTSITPTFYDSSADAQNIQYPHFFVKLLKTREDRFTGRVIPPYGQNFLSPVDTTPKAYGIVARHIDGQISAPGNVLRTSTFRIRLIQPGYLIRVQSGNNIGTYTVTSVSAASTPYSITVSNTLLNNLPKIIFEPTDKRVYFTTPIDLNTVKLNDNFVDASSVSFPIMEINTSNSSIRIGNIGTPNTATGSSITRTGNVFQNTDSTPLTYLIMDPTKPVNQVFTLGTEAATTNFKGRSPTIPIDAYYLIRIDSKERDTHVDVLNRMWEEFNPPRTALPTIVRGPNSDDQLLIMNALAGTNIITVADNCGFNINDPVFVFDNFHPTKGPNDNFEVPFAAKVIGKIAHNQLVLDTALPSDFTVANVAKIVNNAYYYLHMFHFVDHNTRDNEGAQYWVHEFTFWVQIFVDRLEVPETYTAITDIATTLEDFQGNIIIQDD